MKDHKIYQCDKLGDIEEQTNPFIVGALLSSDGG
jgi:hypothetical protein